MQNRKLRIFLLSGFLSLTSLFFMRVNVFAQDTFITIEKPLIGTNFEVQSDVALSGTATPDSDITLDTKDGEYAKLRSDKDGKWSYTIPTVSDGTFTIRATVTNKIDSLSSKTASANVTYNVSPPPTQNVTHLAQTGLLVFVALPIGLFMIVATIYTYFDYRRHKKPLTNADPHVNYSFWHHLRVVSIPVVKYRLSINIDKRLPTKADKIRRY